MFSKPFNEWEIGEVKTFLFLINSRRTYSKRKGQAFLEGGFKWLLFS